MKSDMEYWEAVYLISSQCLSIQASRSSEKDSAPRAKTASRVKEIRQLYRTKSIILELSWVRPRD